jgi:hypothetical protein
MNTLRSLRALAIASVTFFFSLQKPIDVNAIKTVPLRKCDLASFTINCGPQQSDDLFLIKYVM